MTCSQTDRLLQTLRVHVPGATDDLLTLELFNVVDEFLRRTSAWRYAVNIDISGADTDATGAVEFPVPMPGNSQMVRVITAYYNGSKVPAASSGVVQSSVGTLIPAQQFPDGDAMFLPFQVDTAPPSDLFTYAVYRPGYISITNPPTVEPLYPFEMTMALSVGVGCLECDCGDWDIPDWMFETYFQDWEDGILARLYSMPAKPWRDMVLAQYHGKRFRNEMALRKQEAARGFEYNVQNWQFPRAGWP
jgi:hypothetical protein